MKRGLCFAYTVDGGIYLNMTNRCTNACVFCIRNNGDGAYGSDSLWLEREPSVREMLDAVADIYTDETRELVFCGYGEPSVRLNECVEIAVKLRERYPKTPIRINTNGHSDLIFGCDTSRFFGVFDKVSVSLNAPDSEKYDELCRPKFKEKALDSILNFSKNVNDSFHNVVFSVVREMLSDSELAECVALSERLCIPLRIRDYISE